MSPSKRIAVVASVATVVAFLGFHLCSNFAEVFYVALPISALTYFLTGITDWRHAFATQLRPGITIAIGLFTLSLGIAFLFLGAEVALSWHFWVEAATCLYFLTSIMLVLMAIRRALLSFAVSAQERWRFSPVLRLVLCEALPLALFVLFALPIGIAFAQVHRFKVPIFATPRTFWNRDYDEIEFQSADGTDVRGWWIPAKKSSGRTVVICHGIAANRSIFLPFVEVGDWLDANVLIFDLRGHGESGGRSITLGYREKQDVVAAVEWARREKPEQSREVIGYGISLGAARLAEAAPHVEPPLDGVILDSCFASTRDMVPSVLAPFPSTTRPWLVTLGLPLADWHAGCPMMNVSPENSIVNLRAPVLLLHSRGDPLIPSEHALRIYERASTPKHVCVFDIDGHANAFFVERERYREEVTAFSVRLAPRER